MIRNTFAAVLLASAATLAALPAQAQETFDAKQTDAVRKIVRDYLIHFGQGFIYTTALPPWHGDMALAMLEQIRCADDRRAHLHELGIAAREILRETGLTVHGEAHILALEVGDELRCQELATALRREGILLFAARYPTVPLGQAILRVCLTSEHRLADIERLRDALRNALKEVTVK